MEVPLLIKYFFVCILTVRVHKIKIKLFKLWYIQTQMYCLIGMYHLISSRLFARTAFQQVFRLFTTRLTTYKVLIAYYIISRYSFFTVTFLKFYCFYN